MNREKKDTTTNEEADAEAAGAELYALVWDMVSLYPRDMYDIALNHAMRFALKHGNVDGVRVVAQAMASVSVTVHTRTLFDVAGGVGVGCDDAAAAAAAADADDEVVAKLDALLGAGVCTHPQSAAMGALEHGRIDTLCLALKYVAEWGYTEHEAAGVMGVIRGYAQASAHRLRTLHFCILGGSSSSSGYLLPRRRLEDELACVPAALTVIS